MHQRVIAKMEKLRTIEDPDIVKMVAENIADVVCTRESLKATVIDTNAFQAERTAAIAAFVRHTSILTKAQLDDLLEGTETLAPVPVPELKMDARPN
jgi:hypothetical protein